MAYVTFCDGTQHELGKPSFKTMQVLKETHGIDLEQGFTQKDLPAIIAALIKRANPSFDLDLEQVIDQIPYTMDGINEMTAAVSASFGFPIEEAKGEKSERPTRGKGGDTKP